MWCSRCRTSCRGWRWPIAGACTACCSRRPGETLLELAADPQHLGAQIGAVMVLHTWGQNLEHHPHVHCVVPGGGLSPDGQRWIASHPEFFLPVVALSRLFRGKFLAGLKRLHRQGKLQLADKLLPLFDAQDFAAWLSPLYQKEWVVYVPAAGVARTRSRGGAEVPGALRGGGGHQRCAAALACATAESPSGPRTIAKAASARRSRLPEQEFVRRFLLHVLPRGFVRVRYYGLLANTQRAALLAHCRTTARRSEARRCRRSQPPATNPPRPPSRRPARPVAADG